MKTHAGARAVEKAGARPVSRPHDADEREADRAADVVARGGSVSGWSFSSLPLSAPAVQRQEAGKPKSEEEKYKDAALKAGEAALKTPEGEKLKEKVLADPLVKTVKDAATSPAGIAVGVGAGAAGAVALGAAGKELPFQPPAIPLDRITPGLSAQVTYKGPVNAPTFVGLSVTYKEQGAPDKGPKKTASEKYREETARLAAEQAAFRRGLRYPPGSKEAEEQRQLDEAVARIAAGRFGSPAIVIPLTSPPAEKEEKKAPVQPAPASGARAPSPARAHVDDALATPGRPLDATTRRGMESRFGRDFSGVRIHDDARAAARAAAIDAAAFTVGQDVVFASGRYDPVGAAGQRLLAHELAHVAQQADGGRARLQRKAEPAVSSPGDPAEREAEEAAERMAAGAPVTDAGSAPSGAILRQDEGAEAPEEELEWPPLEDDPEYEGPDVQASRTAGPATAPRGFARTLASVGGGESVPAAQRRTLERAFGDSFASVRLHRDSASNRLARSIGAQAFTSGADIHLAASAPSPTSPAGLRLLAHELTHVRQQAAARGRDPTVHRSRALYFSTHGRQGYFRFAEAFHRDRGFPAPVRVSSVEEMLEHLVALPRPLQSVRLVSHAVPAGIFLPLLRGGTTSLFAADLALQSQTALEEELETEHPTIRTRGGDDPSAFEAQDVSHHVVPQHWVATAYRRLAAAGTNRTFLRTRQFPDDVTPDGDLESLIWWILDREIVQAQRERPGRRGRTRMVHLISNLPRRAAVAASLDRNAGIYRERARDHLLLRGYPQRGTQDARRTAATEAVAEFERRLVAVAGPLIDELSPGQSFLIAGPTPRYETVQGALERGTFSNNVLFAKVAIPNGMPLEIRGCRIGQNPGWLESFRDFWGMGAGTTRRRPDVSAPDLRHVFGRRGRDRATAEWLQGRRGRAILGGTPEFDEHIVHAT